jgi:glycosyltransferase involved in cell wall biosynthesis
MTEKRRERARVVVVTYDDAGTLRDCLDSLRDQVAGSEVWVVDLDSADGTADVAIRHDVPARVVVVPPGDLDRVIDAGAMGLGPGPLVLLPGDRRPAPGWLDAALAALRPAWVAIGADGDLRHLALDRPHLAHVRLLDGVADADELAQRVRAAGGEVAVAAAMRTEPARPEVDAGASRPPLPVTTRAPRSTARHEGIISVVLCTRDRPDHLVRCLASLAALDDPCHEIVVVDNHDRPTLEVELPARARLVHEPRRGLDVARNRGIAEARGDVIAFIDDDCEADPHWLDNLRVAFADPRIDAVTGRVRPAALTTPGQRWFEERFSFDRGARPRWFTPWDRREWYPLWMGGIGTGCNMAFRRAAITGIGGFDELLDMGTAIGGGGDLDAFARLVDRGALLHYAPGALVWHHHRATEVEARRQFWGYGVSVGALLTKTALERRGCRVAAVRFFLDRLRVGARTIRHGRAGAHLVPAPLVLLDLAGQLAGVPIYLASRARDRRRAG